MCKTKQGSKLVDMSQEFIVFTSVDDKKYHISKKSILAILADYVFEVDKAKFSELRVLHSPEYWLPKGEDIV